MKNVALDLPTFAFVLVTRAVLAGGLGLLLSDKLSDTRRRTIGAVLVAIGAITTIPAAMSVARHLRRSGGAPTAMVDRDKQLIGATRFPRKGDDDDFM
ncbi:MAG: hypothetical protein GEU82_01265 [Luteitalea sp.]|nr:hypothetical protein [Luteitalea sp.]